jgi:4-amino-4-deoxy-L-arabinose transferase-like glycosyltransferase
MKRWQEIGLLIIILVMAAVLRLTGIDWDDYLHYHPDERYITWVATTIEFSLQNGLNPTESTFNPFYWPPEAASEGILVLQDEHRDFAYGHVPLYLGVLATRLLEWLGPPLATLFPANWLLTRDVLNGAGAIEFRQMTAVSRTLTALFDVATILLVYLLGKHIYDARVGLLAAAFLAVNVMHIQLAHFFISDPFLTFFVVAAVLGMVASGQVGSEEKLQPATCNLQPATCNPFYVLLSAIFIGLAIGSKFTAVLLFLPLGLTLYLFCGEKWWRWLATAVLITFLSFLITNPFAILDLSCEVITPAGNSGPLAIPALDWRSCYLENVVAQAAMVNGRSDIAFTRQYSGSLPYLYFIEMQIRWGMGLLLGLAAFAGLLWAIWHVIKPFTIPHSPFIIHNSQFIIHNSPHLILLAWVVPYFLFTGAFHVKFMRYLQPITPFLMLYAAAMLLSIKLKWVRWAAITAVLLATTLYALSFVNLYRQPHPWVAGSIWVYENIPPGALILSEQWDDALPSTMLVNGRPRRRDEYQNAELTWLTGADENDSEEKLEQNLAWLAAGDYLTIMSDRVYGVVPRLDGRYPLSSQYHQLLFDGSLGYEPVYLSSRSPNLFGIHLIPDWFGGSELSPPEGVKALWEDSTAVTFGRADESFTVYDQPLLILFQNTGHLTAEEMLAQFKRQ